MKDEFNDITKPTVNANVQAPEFNDPKEYNQEILEYSDLQSHAEAKAKSKTSIIDQINNIIRTITLTATTGTVAILATIFILGVDLTGTRPAVNFIEYGASEGMVYYNIEIGEADNLSIRLYNDKYTYENEAFSGENFGEFYEIEDGETYMLAVCGDPVYGNDVISEVEVYLPKRFSEEVEDILTPIDEIEVVYECMCNIDGCFHFKIEYVDTMYRYYDFRVRFIGEEGDEIEFYLNYPYNSEQKIDVSEINLTGDKSKVRFVITCMYEDVTYTLIDEEVSI